MSEYLITEIEGTSNIDVMYRVELVGGAGDGRLETVDIRHQPSGAVDTLRASAVFILIGAEPFTQWLPSTVQRDDWGFVTTGPSHEAATRLPFESTLPGVFAVGDVRRDSTKRVASAAGEGAVCVRVVHEYLAARRGHEHAGNGAASKLHR
jgi:thioredoxin reductase (NADPH)